MTTSNRSLVLILVGGLLTACNVADSEVPGKAMAMLMPTSAASTVSGSVSFTDVGGKVTGLFLVTGATPGMHGLHIHANASCESSTAMDGKVTPGGAAGGHWNPDNAAHGDSGAGTAHAGDIGNMMVDADGTGRLTYASPDWDIKEEGPGLLMGHAVVFHASPDDLMTQPTGNAGGRQACGVIVAQ